MTTPNPDTTSNDGTRRAGVIGGLLGAIAIVAALVALSVGASASQTELVGDSPAAVQAAAQVDDVDAAIDEEPAESTDGADEQGDDDAEASESDPFADIDEKFEAFDACLAENGVDVEGMHGEIELPDIDIEGLDLDNINPEDLEELFGEAFGDFDFPEFDGDFEFPEFDGEFEFHDSFGPAVSVMDGDDLTVADFGEGDGTITITKTGDDITVTSSGDVTVETVEPFAMFDDLVEGFEFDGDWEFPEFDGEGMFGFELPDFEELDKAFDACEDLLPEDSFGFGGGFFGPAIEHGEDA